MQKFVDVTVAVLAGLFLVLGGLGILFLFLAIVGGRPSDSVLVGATTIAALGGLGVAICCLYSAVRSDAPRPVATIPQPFNRQAQPMSQPTARPQKRPTARKPV